MEGNFLVVDGVKFAKPNIFHNTISKKLGYSLSPQPPFERGALVDRCVAPVDRNGISSRLGGVYETQHPTVVELMMLGYTWFCLIYYLSFNILHHVFLNSVIKSHLPLGYS